MTLLGNIISKTVAKGLNSFINLWRRSIVNIRTFSRTTKYNGFPGNECSFCDPFGRKRRLCMSEAVKIQSSEIHFMVDIISHSTNHIRNLQGKVTQFSAFQKRCCRTHEEILPEAGLQRGTRRTCCSNLSFSSATVIQLVECFSFHSSQVSYLQSFHSCIFAKSSCRLNLFLTVCGQVQCIFFLLLHLCSCSSFSVVQMFHSFRVTIKVFNELALICTSRLGGSHSIFRAEHFHRQLSFSHLK